MTDELLLTGKDWEIVNRKAGVDVLDIVVNLDNRYTPAQQADLIVERCNLTAKAQLAKAKPLIEKQERERIYEKLKYIVTRMKTTGGINPELALESGRLRELFRLWQALKGENRR